MLSQTKSSLYRSNSRWWDHWAVAPCNFLGYAQLDTTGQHLTTRHWRVSCLLRSGSRSIFLLGHLFSLCLAPPLRPLCHGWPHHWLSPQTAELPRTQGHKNLSTVLGWHFITCYRLLIANRNNNKNSFVQCAFKELNDSQTHSKDYDEEWCSKDLVAGFCMAS